MEITRTVLGILFTQLLVLFFSALAHDGGYSVFGADLSQRSKKHPELTVLGYVTPWNSRGSDFMRDHRGKFDIACPVWYTISADEGQAKVYEVKGSPAGEKDIEWYQELQEVSVSGNKPLQVTPRFLLDGWDQDDYRSLVFNQTRWQLLADSILRVVKEMNYDGLVFESSATHALVAPLSVLSASLHANKKILIVVSPPIRSAIQVEDAHAINRYNGMIIESIASLADIADYISIMTYDMTGPLGRESISNKESGPAREPGPNTSINWIQENLAAFLHASSSTMNNLHGKYEEQLSQIKQKPRVKFLVGLPLYGYTYPIILLDKNSGRRTHSSGHQDDAAAILRGPGEAIASVDIERIVQAHKPKISETEEGEPFFDYVKETDDSLWRIFMPSQESLTHAIKTVLEVFSLYNHSSDGIGLALWELGQSPDDLLSSI